MGPCHGSYKVKFSSANDVITAVKPLVGVRSYVAALKTMLKC